MVTDIQVWMAQRAAVRMCTCRWASEPSCLRKHFPPISKFHLGKCHSAANPCLLMSRFIFLKPPALLVDGGGGVLADRRWMKTQWRWSLAAADTEAVRLTERGGSIDFFLCWQGGAVGSAVTSYLRRLQVRFPSLGPLCAEFACSLHVYMGYLGCLASDCNLKGETSSWEQAEAGRENAYWQHLVVKCDVVVVVIILKVSHLIFQRSSSQHSDKFCPVSFHLAFKIHENLDVWESSQLWYYY